MKIAAEAVTAPQLRLLDTPLWATICVDRLIYHAFLRDERDYADHLLDLKYPLLLGTSAEELLRAFYAVWKPFGDRDYAMFFKLRRWLEQRITLRLSSSSTGQIRLQALRLSFVSLETLVRSHQNAWFQEDLRLPSLDDVQVSFDWLER